MSSSENNKKNEGGNSVMLKVATFIVDRRNLFFLLIGIALIFSAIASRWVRVENDLAAYLPDSAETSRGISLMNDQFITYGSARLMVTNITYDEACDICD
ncbi:MAG: RND transporter, partial [Lachnospiraceae bacterium]|nr:RND transporter [Lachnospiraceae bacterium]